MAQPLKRMNSLEELKRQTHHRSTKIVCSVGPSCQTADVLAAMLREGVDVFRVNCSFGDPNLLRGMINEIRQASKQTSIPCSILGDLQGPKFRTGDMDVPSMRLEVGKRYPFIATKEKGNLSRICTPNEILVKSLSVGDRVLINDGIMEIKVVERVSDLEVITEVVRPGELLARKGLNVPQAQIQFDDLQEKDKRDALVLLDEQIDFIGQSFVQTKDDIILLKKYLHDNAKPGQFIPKIVAKIEKPQALQNIDDILTVTDGIMVARGDLGVELSLEMVPIAQKMLIKKANSAEIPVITATQMLQSMMTETVPLRAEVSDVANAIFDGTDAVMTSGETAMSPHPALVVQTMAKIVRTTEVHLPRGSTPIVQRIMGGDQDLRVAIASASLNAANNSSSSAIIVLDESGEMTMTISKGRPACPVICITPNVHIANFLRLAFGVYPIVMPFGKYTETTLAGAEESILSSGLLKRGDLVVLCGGKSKLLGISNTTKIYQIGEFLTQFTDKWRKHVASFIPPK